MVFKQRDLISPKIVFMKFISGIIIFLLLIFLPREILIRHALASDDNISLGLFPSTESFAVNDIKIFDLKLDFADSSALEKLNYFKAEISFPKEILSVPEGRYVDTALSGLNRIVRVDGSVAANNSGKIIVELKTEPSDSGPQMVGQINIARLYFLAQKPTSSPQYIRLDNVKLLSNDREVVLNGQNINQTSFTVTGGNERVSIQNEKIQGNGIISTPAVSDIPVPGYVTPTPLPQGVGAVIQNFFNLLFCRLFRICK